MKSFSFLMLVSVIFYGAASAHGQSAAPASTQPAAAPAVSASASLQPALHSISASLTGLQPDKWKLPGPMKEETVADIGSIHRDLDTTLPPMLATADAAPGSVSASLPVSANVNALYNVVLRVTERARMSAPEQQSAALDQARANLESARRAYDSRLQSAASAQETQMRAQDAQMRTLRANLQTQTQLASAAATQAAKPVPCTPATHTTVKRKTTAKPATTKPATTSTPPGM